MVVFVFYKNEIKRRLRSNLIVIKEESVYITKIMS
jgi:hypothetical protein